MPDTFPALVVLVLALLPGALYVWSFERIVGPWGVGLSDRVLRFIGASAILHAIAAPVTFWLYRNVLPDLDNNVSIHLWLVPLAYVGLPIALGSLVGTGVLRQWRWVETITGRDPAPRAWDYLFGQHPDGWVRMMLKSGVWLGGAFAETESGWRSYVSAYPEPQDIFLVESVEVDPETGEFLLDDDGEPLRRGSSILVRWDEVEYLEFIDA